jgi:hypothetical protein
MPINRLICTLEIIIIFKVKSLIFSDSSFNLTQQVSSLNIENNPNKQQQKNVWNWLTQNRLVNTLKVRIKLLIILNKNLKKNLN